jgi:hypothetical protein
MHGTGARIGQINGADLTLMGDILVFGRDDRSAGGGVGGSVIAAVGARTSRLTKPSLCWITASSTSRSARCPQGGAKARENDLDALVADVSGGTLTINAGTGAGLQVFYRVPQR